MCQRLLYRLVCGHIDEQYHFCDASRQSPNFDANVRLPCDNVTQDQSQPPRDGDWPCRLPACAFEARGRSWACCRCRARPNLAGSCGGLRGTCKHVCCISCEHYRGEPFFPDTREAAWEDLRRQREAREEEGKEEEHLRRRHRHRRHDS